MEEIFRFCPFPQSFKIFKDFVSQKKKLTDVELKDLPGEKL